MADVNVESNLLLASLPLRERARLLGRLEYVTLPTNEVLFELDQRVEHLYFPARGCVIAVIKVINHKKTLAAGLAGYEGFVGFEPFLGVSEAQFRAVVRVGGGAFRMNADVFSEGKRPAGRLSAVLDRYLQYLLLAFSQKAGCNCFHCLDEHFCSWLLSIRDRTASDKLVITQQVLAKMLGVRRAGITQTARKLQDAGLIRYRWGKIHILDPKRLEGKACVCYRQTTDAYQRLLDKAWPYH